MVSIAVRKAMDRILSDLKFNEENLITNRLNYLMRNEKFALRSCA